MVQGDRLAGQLPRPPPRRRRQHGSYPHPLREHGHRGHHHPRIVRVHLPDTDAVPVEGTVPTRLLRLTGELSDRARIPVGTKNPYRKRTSSTIHKRLSHTSIEPSAVGAVREPPICISCKVGNGHQEAW